jgi:hypothetical protein
MYFGHSAFRWNAPLSESGAQGDHMVEHTPPSSRHREFDRRIFPDRRRYSYSLYIPERRGTTAKSVDLKLSRKAASADDGIDQPPKEWHGYSDALPISTKAERGLPSRISRKRLRMHSCASMLKCKRQVYVKMQSEIDKIKQPLLTKEEVLQLIRKL